MLSFINIQSLARSRLSGAGGWQLSWSRRHTDDQQCSDLAGAGESCSGCPGELCSAAWRGDRRVEEERRRQGKGMEGRDR